MYPQPPASSSQPIGLRDRYVAISQPATASANPLTELEITRVLSPWVHDMPDTRPATIAVSTSAIARPKRAAARTVLRRATVLLNGSVMGSAWVLPPPAR